MSQGLQGFPSHIAAMLLLVLFTGGINQGWLQGGAIVFTGLMHALLLQSLVPLKDVFLTFNGVSGVSLLRCFFIYYSLCSLPALSLVNG
jgi:hypothetical protein